MQNEMNSLYAVVCGGVNIDILKDDRENNSCSHNKCRPDGEIQ